MDFNPARLQDIIDSELAHYSNQSDLRLMRCDALSASLLKKFNFEDADSADRRKRDAYALFFQANAHSAEWCEPSDLELRSILMRARAHLHELFYDKEGQNTTFNLTVIARLGRTGPGASVGTKRRDLYGKLFDGPLSVSSELLYEHYKTTLTGRWILAEKFRSDSFPTVVVGHSNLNTVPKNRSIDRVICTEPSLNMYYQLGAGRYLEKILKRSFDIDLSTQPDINKGLARRGSLDGSYATIDFSSASDTISAKFVRFMLPPAIYGVLQCIRSGHTMCEKELHELHMVSTMGNGFTFPLQTLLFAVIVRACFDHVQALGVGEASTRVHVFGDDIVVPTGIYDVACRAFHAAGFKVNGDKSFANGPFRESCGGDYFLGHDVRGVYIKKAKTVEDIYSIFNRLTRWSARHRISLDRSLRYVKGLVDFRPVPLHAGDDEGFKVPSYFLNNPKFDRNGCWRYKSHQPRLKKRKVATVGFAMSDSGAITAFVGGYLAGGGYAVHDFETTYKVVPRRTPHWDYITDPGLTIQDYFDALVSIF